MGYQLRPFRLLRRLWPTDPASRPMLAFLAASTRDTLLRRATEFVIGIELGDVVSPSETAAYVADTWPNRFKESTANALAIRLASTWTQAGYLSGKVNKRRTRPHVSPTVMAYAVALGHMTGLRGKALMTSERVRLLDRAPEELASLAVEAARQGWLNYRSAGGVVDITPSKALLEA